MGPLCFLMLINDVLTDTPHRWKYYMDDSTVGIPVFSPLQATLDSLQMWTEVNKVSINHTKTVVMHFCTSSPPVPSLQLSVGSHPLQVVQSTRLLGITLDDRLNWKQYVTDTLRSASYKIYMLRRLKSLGTPADELKEVYTSFILPKLMYASPAWSSSLNITQHQHQLEKIKKRALRLIIGPAYHDYECVLNTINLARLSVKHEEALTKFWEGLLKHTRHRKLLPPDAPPRPPRPCYHTQERV